MEQNDKIFNLSDFLVDYRPDYVSIQNEIGDSVITFFSAFLVSFLFIFSVALTVDGFNLDISMIFSSFEYIKEQGFMMFFIFLFYAFCSLWLAFTYAFSLYYFVTSFFKLSDGVFNFKTFSVKKMEALSIKDFKNKIKLFDIEDLLLLISSEKFKNGFSKEDKEIVIETIREMKTEKITEEKKETILIEND